MKYKPGDVILFVRNYSSIDPLDAVRTIVAVDEVSQRVTYSARYSDGQLEHFDLSVATVDELFRKLTKLERSIT